MLQQELAGLIYQPGHVLIGDYTNAGPASRAPVIPFADYAFVSLEIYAAPLNIALRQSRMLSQLCFCAGIVF